MVEVLVEVTVVESEVDVVELVVVVLVGTVVAKVVLVVRGGVVIVATTISPVACGYDVANANTAANKMIANAAEPRVFTLKSETSCQVAERSMPGFLVSLSRH